MLDLKNEKFDIVIQGGQSNADGSGIGDVEVAYVPTEKVYYLNSEKTVDTLEDGLKIEFFDKPFQFEIANYRYADDKVIGDLSLTFSEEYIKRGCLKDGRKLLIIRAAIGGTGFFKKHWGLQDMLYLKMLEMTDFALKLNPENKVVAFLWHQGEHDAFEGNPADVYYTQLNDMLSDVRERYGEIPFIAGDFANEWKSLNIEICEPIIQTIKDVVGNNDRCAFVETSDLLSNNQKTGNGDNIHFCRESLHELGRRYFSEYFKIIQKSNI